MYRRWSGLKGVWGAGTRPIARANVVIALALITGVDLRAAAMVLRVIDRFE